MLRTLTWDPPTSSPPVDSANSGGKKRYLIMLGSSDGLHRVAALARFGEFPDSALARRPRPLPVFRECNSADFFLIREGGMQFTLTGLARKIVEACHSNSSTSTS